MVRFSNSTLTQSIVRSQYQYKDLYIIGEVVGKQDPREVVTSKGVTVKNMAVVIEDIRMHIDPNLKVVDEFRTIILTGADSNGVRITLMDSQSVVYDAQELKRGNVDISTVEEVYNAQEATNVFIFGKIMAMNFGKTAWCYKACVKCPKKFETKIGDVCSCKKCNITFEKPKDR
ncbi:hypothetical protein PIB30_084667 [Stylosanthes scabra]|uniref:Uncharacterized protein n=1 Tax=Stylosanthes scabra TaxID=79078 RepID=A0ABU6TTB6_9FABA|nr:hypothetical protein [Stylosanthes scabra]